MTFGRLEGLPLKEVLQDLYRNIVSLRESQDLYDDLSDEPGDWRAAVDLEATCKPPHYESHQPVIDRPFEEAAFLDAIQFPFDNLGESRFSRGHFGVWYGSEDLETTIHETVYHWQNHLLADAGFRGIEGVEMERRVHLVRCDAALINLTDKITEWPELIGDNHAPCQALGDSIHQQGHPGLWTRSARSAGNNAAIFTPRVLSNPRVSCYLTYRVERGGVAVYRVPGEVLLTI